MELIIKNGTRKFGCFSLEQLLTGMLKIIGCIGQKLVINNLWDLACCILFLLMQLHELPLAFKRNEIFEICSINQGSPLLPHEHLIHLKFTFS